ncbi:MAG: dTMP kinase, partial [Thermoguttaceae bacterium]|nr:dTMP kinase [Thermoguttaceae bacterium]
ESLMFIVIDGGDGTGKSTQITALAQGFQDRHEKVVTCRDPGSTRLGEEIRATLLGTKDILVCDRSETFLFMAARAQMIDEFIRPAIDSGTTVLLDRFLLSTVVYQGYAAGQNIDDIWEVGRIALADCIPDLTIVLDLEPDVARLRIDRPLDRMELKGNEYHRRVREGFLTAVKQWPQHFSGRCELVDAQGSSEEVSARIAEMVWQK